MLFIQLIPVKDILLRNIIFLIIPVAVAAALAVQDIFEKDDIFNRAKNLAPYFQKGLFSLQDLEKVDNRRGDGMRGEGDLQLVVANRIQMVSGKVGGSRRCEATNKMIREASNKTV